MMRLSVIATLLFSAGCGAQGDPVAPAAEPINPGPGNSSGPVTNLESIGPEPITFAL
ncbi:MAG: argininosuccinate lyase [Paracoccaceae bacterium]